MKKSVLVIFVIVIILVIVGLVTLSLFKNNKSTDVSDNIKNTLTNITKHLYECYNDCPVDNSNDLGVIDYSCSIDCHNYNNKIESELNKYSPKELTEFISENVEIYMNYLYIQECAVQSCEDYNNRHFRECTLDCFSEKNNIDDCKNIVHLPTNMILCVNHIAIKTKDYSACEKYPGYSYDQYGGIVKNPNREDGVNSCYMQVAILKWDLSKCENILDGKWSSPDDCYRGVAIGKNDLSICEKISDLSIKEDCISGVAIAKKDWKICEKIKDDKVKDNCYMNVAMHTENIEICEKISDGTSIDEYSGSYKENCYGYIIMYGDDESICGEIEDEKIKKFCYDYFKD